MDSFWNYTMEILVEWRGLKQKCPSVAGGVDIFWNYILFGGAEA